MQSYSSLHSEFHDILKMFQKSSNFKDQSFDSKKENLISNIIDENSSEQNAKRILSEFCSYGPLDSLLSKDSINEIIINNRNHICYEQSGILIEHKDCFLSEITFNNIVERLCSEARLTTNYKKPFAEGKWNQFRIHVTRPPIIKKDFHISLRKHPKTVWDFKKLFDNEWASQIEIDTIKKIIRDKQNVLIVGPTSAGKTSVLNACLQELPETERVISIEDADEIVLPNKVSTKLLTQTSLENTLAHISQEDLLKESLRLRPDRLVLGEVRGAEAKNLLLALSSGHQGSIGTIHANNHKQAISKLEMLVQMGAHKWKNSTVRSLIHFGLQFLIVVDKIDGQRILKGIYQISSLESTGFLFETIFEKP